MGKVTRDKRLLTATRKELRIEDDSDKRKNIRSGNDDYFKILTN